MSELRVLIVDDLDDIAEVTRMVLEMRGCVCETADSGAAALEIAARFQPQIAILDLGLPDISGLELAGQLRERVDGPLHLAAVTGWSSDQVLEDTRAAGFDQYVLKPTNIAALDKILAAAKAA